jgi:hypothetical protein
MQRVEVNPKVFWTPSRRVPRKRSVILHPGMIAAPQQIFSLE